MKPIIKEQQELQIQQLPPGFVLNPNTNKLIRVGSAKYNELLRQCEVEDIPKPIKKNSKIISSHKTPTEALKQKLNLEREPTPINKVYSISNNRKHVLLKDKKRKSLTINDMTGMITKATANVNKKLSGKFDDDENIEDIQHQKFFRGLIEQELLLISQQKNKPKQPKQPKILEYEEEDEDEYETDD